MTDHDFGGLAHHLPRAVIRPTTAAEVAAAVRDAARRGLRVVARGTGHSAYGQAQLAGGVLLDLRGLRGVPEPETDRITVGAGATWREVLDVTLPELTPPVLTDYLDLTVGGTVAAGGIGGTSHRHGTQTDHVLELQVVTGTGEIVTCSAEEHRSLFDAVRGGLGRCAVIIRATLRLVPAPHRVLSRRLVYAGPRALLDAQRAAAPGHAHISGQAKPRPPDVPGERWFYELHAAAFDSDPEPAEPPGDLVELAELPYLEYADRLRPDVAELVTLGEWARPHPWGMVFLPGTRAPGVIGATLAALEPRDMGLSGVVLINPLRGRGTPSLALPPEPVLFGLLRTASPGATPAAEMLAGNRALYERAVAVGGARYAVDAVPFTAGERAAGLGVPRVPRATSRRYDPGDVLGGQTGAGR